jgi:PRTRC genetic system protein E
MKKEMDTMPTQTATPTDDEATTELDEHEDESPESDDADPQEETGEGEDADAQGTQAEDDAESAGASEENAGIPAEPFVPSPPLTLTTRQQPGVIQGLASSIPVNGTVLLAITKTAENALLVTVQPTIDKDNAASSKALQVAGTPEEIDRGLLDALAHYVPARELVLASAEQIAKETAAAAAHAKAEADKRRANAPAKTTPATPAARQEQLTVKALPANAKITVTDQKGKAGEIKSDTATKLDIGTYNVLVEAEGYDSNSQTVRLLKPQSVVVVLKKTSIPQPSLLG